jgi:hypothetical protein
MRSLALLLALCVSAAAQQFDIEGLPPGAPVIHGVAVACDTQEQVKAYLEKGQDEAAMQAVNAEWPHACGMNSFVYLEGPEGEKVGEWTLIRILIVGIITEHGFASVAPAPQWSAFSRPTKGA